MRLGEIIGEGTPSGYGVIRYRARDLHKVDLRKLLGTTATVTEGEDTGATGIVVRVDREMGEVDLMQPDAYRAFFGKDPGVVRRA